MADSDNKPRKLSSLFQSYIINTTTAIFYNFQHDKLFTWKFQTIFKSKSGFDKPRSDNIERLMSYLGGKSECEQKFYYSSEND